MNYMVSPVWRALILENLNASSMIQDGLQRLCRVNVEEIFGSRPVEWVSPLYLGLLDFTAGLERLAKITVSISGLLHGDSFTPVRRYGHKISKLLDAVEAIQLPAGFSCEFSARPTISQEPKLLELIDRFSVGAGRYENIDFLTVPDRTPELYDAWCEIVRNEPVPEHVEDLIILRKVIAEQTLDAANSGDFPIDLETIILNWTDLEDARPVFAPSSTVAVQLSILTRWVADVQERINFALFRAKPSTPVKIPYLYEATANLRLSPEHFFEHVVMEYSSADDLIEAIGN